MKPCRAVFVSIVVLFVWLMPGLAAAQGGGAEKLQKLMERTTPGERAHFEDFWMKRELKLSDDQAAKVGEINLRNAERMQSVFDSQGGKFRKVRQIMKARDEKDAELQGVLSSEQFGKYKQRKEAMWQKMQDMKRSQ